MNQLILGSDFNDRRHVRFLCKSHAIIRVAFRILELER